MEKKFFKPEMKIIIFDTADVITSSTSGLIPIEEEVDEEE